MNITTKTLSGAEISVAIGGQNTEIRNDGAAMIYASANAGVVAGADGVVAIPAGAAVTVLDTRGTVYLLGTGEVSVVGKDTVSAVFKCAPTTGGSGQDDVARQAITAHAGNAEIHVTAEEKAKWDEVNYSNPNLLINPDFAVNQRGQTEYTAAGYTVDRWWINNSTTTLTKLDNGIKLSGTGGMIRQIIENPERFAGKTITASIFLDTIVGSALLRLRVNGSFSGYLSIINKAGLAFATFTLPEELTSLYFELGMVGSDNCEYTISNSKLELGKIATPIIPADPATELAKCQRYYYKSNGQIVFCARTGMVPYQNYYSLPITMRVNPTIKIYDAEGTEGYASLKNDNSTKVAISTACTNGRDFNIWATNSDMVTDSEYRITYTASAEL